MHARKRGRMYTHVQMHTRAPARTHSHLQGFRTEMPARPPSHAHSRESMCLTALSRTCAWHA
eukprot:97792-Pleurochrysis_carterae.AAC.1